MAVDFHIDRGVGILTLHDEKTRNALTAETVLSALALLHEQLEHVHGFVITGEGTIFCSGADIHSFEQLDLAERAAASPIRLFQSVWETSVPVVAAVEGGALGGGAELCIACDAVVCSTSAWFSFPELGVGVYPTTAARLLPGIVGRSQALVWMATRRRISAAEAATAGLVSFVVPAGQGTDMAVALVLQIHQGAAPSAWRELKKVIKPAIDWNAIASALDYVDVAERLEGAQAFHEHRVPHFS